MDEIAPDQDAPSATERRGASAGVTAAKGVERALAELAAIVRGSGDAIIAFTVAGRITHWNPAATLLFGFTEEQAVGSDVRLLIPDERIREHDDRVAGILAGGGVEHFEARMQRSDGMLIDVAVGMSPARDEDGNLLGISMIGRDATERKRFDAQLKRLADGDPVTGLFNRRRFEEEVQVRVRHARRYGGSGAVLLLDIDDFRLLNDAMGRGAGDEILRSVGELLRGRLRESDITARVGGDEFAVLLPTAGPDDAFEVASALLHEIRSHVAHVGGRPVTVTTSIGIAPFESATDSAESVMAEADRALYLAKDAGRDRAAALGPAERRLAAEPKLGWENRIREALEHDLFVLHSQPILDLRTGETSRHELLLRMTDGDELIEPGRFLGVAERLGLIRAIDRWVVKQAIGLLARRRDLRLEVNLSARSLDDPQLLREIRSSIADHGVDPHGLTFEITETAAIGNLDVARRLAHELSELGCQFALDDFGSGFSSFHYLKQLPAGYLKIDGDFVRGPRSRTDELVVESIVRIAQGLGVKTIAESVEDAATLEAMREAGVDYAQGWHVGRPFPAAKLLDESSARPAG